MLEFIILERARDVIFNIIEYGTAAHGEAATRDYVGKIGARINWLGANANWGQCIANCVAASGLSGRGSTGFIMWPARRN